MNDASEESRRTDLVRSLRAVGEMPLEGGYADPLIDAMNSLAHQAADEIERLGRALALARHQARLIQTSEFSGAITKKIDDLPDHVQAGLRAYRAALKMRQDWHRAVTAAIEAAEAAKESARGPHADLQPQRDVVGERQGIAVRK